jgi:hypothetical protein
VGRDDRRLIVGALCGISATLATALLLGQPHGSLAVWSAELGAHHYWPHLRHLLARKNCATAIQALGALITFYGLGSAYVRAKHDQTVGAWIKTRVERVLAKLFRRPRDNMTIHAPTAYGTFRFGMSASGLVTHNVDISLPLQEQIKRLAQFANNRAREAAEVVKKLGALERDFGKLEHGTAELERNLLEHMETQIRELDNRLDSIQALDLTWAIRGLFISFVGTVLSFGT